MSRLRDDERGRASGVGMKTSDGIATRAGEIGS